MLSEHTKTALFVFFVFCSVLFLVFAFGFAYGRMYEQHQASDALRAIVAGAVKGE